MRLAQLATGLLLTNTALCQPVLDRQTASLGWKASACPSPAVTRRDAWLSLAMQGERHDLTDMNMALRSGGLAHDGLLQVASVGDEESVPMLIEQLGRDYGREEPTGTNRYRGFICTQLHLIEALSSITNTDQGPYYPKWAAWWEANGRLPRRQWMLRGFAAQGLHAADPIDQRFGFELIASLTKKPYYSRRSARILLESIEPTVRDSWLALAARSEDRSLRLGTVDVLKNIESTGNSALLKALTADSDADIRREALTLWNARERDLLSDTGQAGTGVCRVEGKTIGTSRITSIALADDMLIVTYPHRVRAFDIRSLHERWTQQIEPSLGEFILTTADRVILASSDGAIVALDTHGKRVWRRVGDAESTNDVRQVIEGGGDTVLVRAHTLEYLDSSTGATKFTFNSPYDIRHADSSGVALCYTDEVGLHCLNGAEKQFAHSDLVSVRDQAACLTLGESEKDSNLTCLTPATLSPIWTRPIPASRLALIQHAGRVYLDSDWQIAAFRVNDGAPLWSTAELGGTSPVVATDFGILLTGNIGRPELRDPETGVVRRMWRGIDNIRKIAVHDRVAALVSDDVLWIIDLTK
jgi:hypothetical protein